MSILIKGMEMPINCDSCRIMVLEDTNCDSELFCGCPLVFKAYPQGKDHRKPYRGSKAIDPMCRNHGGCPWCEENRKHKFRDKEKDYNGRLQADD